MTFITTLKLWIAGVYLFVVAIWKCWVGKKVDADITDKNAGAGKRISDPSYTLLYAEQEEEYFKDLEQKRKVEQQPNIEEERLVQARELFARNPTKENQLLL